MPPGGGSRNVRDTVATYGAPRPGTDSLARAWDELVGWATTSLTDARETAADADRLVEEARQAGVAQGAAVVARVTEAGIDLAADARPDDAVTALAQALERARHDADTLRERCRQRSAHERERAELGTTVEVAEALGDVLRKNRFEQWLLNRLSVRLVVGASAVLDELTAGAYAISLDDDGNFVIVDHANADETRPARTLSGGETFLASLALALALADHVAAVSQQGAARLDSLFLDEGFGSLDPDALETVASSIEDLSRTRDRMVGVITHVPDLAARIPVRYEVSKTAEGSKVRRVVGGPGTADLTSADLGDGAAGDTDGAAGDTEGTGGDTDGLTDPFAAAGAWR